MLHHLLLTQLVEQVLLVVRRDSYLLLRDLLLLQTKVVLLRWLIMDLIMMLDLMLSLVLVTQHQMVEVL